MTNNYIIYIIKFFLLIFLLYFVGRAFNQHLSTIEWGKLDINFWFLFLTMIFDIIVRILSGMLYDSLLHKLNAHIPYHISLSISWISLLGKYIPGKIAILGTAMYLLSRYKVRPEIAAIVPILANGMVAVSCLLFCAPLFFWEQKIKIFPFSQFLFLLLFLIGVILVLPENWIRIVNWCLNLIKRPSIQVNLSCPQMLYPFLMVILQCLFTGLTTWCMMKTITVVAIASIPIVISISIFAGMIGFLTFFAPAGLGAREGIYLLMLNSLLGPEMAALTAICLRLMQTANDIIMGLAGFGLLYFIPVIKKEN